MSFWLIQRGLFRDLKGEYSGLIGREGLVDLDYMGSSEFEWGAIPHAFIRIMGEKEKYIFHYCNSIKDYKGKILVIFCKKEYADDIKKEMKKYIKEHYRLQEFCTIHAHLEGKDKNSLNEYQIKKDFFWCIDKSATGDWIAWFGMDKLTPFKKVIDKDYNEWWMKKSEDERKKLYEESFSW